MRASSALIRRTSASAVAALLVTGLAACGSDATNTAAGTPATSDATTSAPATTAADAGSTMSAADLAAIIKDSVGSLSTAHESLTMQTEANGRPVELQGEADVRMSPLAMTMTMQMAGQQIQEMFVDGDLYMKMAALPTHGKWLKVDAKQMSTMLGGSVLTDGLSNPLGMLDKMSDHITSASYVGDETVGGASAKHYRMTIDLKAAMAELAPGLPAAAKGAMPASATEDFWVDSSGRAVKTAVDMGTGTMTTVLSDFGKTVDVQAPPADQIMDMSQMQGMGGIGG